MIQLKKSMLECVEDHEQGRLCDALDHLNSDEAPKKKPRMQVTVSHPTAVHSAETPPSSPTTGKQTGSDIEQQQNTESIDPTCRMIQVPAWVGNLDTIKGMSRMISRTRIVDVCSHSSVSQRISNEPVLGWSRT